MQTYIVQELRTSVPLDVVGIEITPTQLNVDPELVARSTIQNILALNREAKVSHEGMSEAKMHLHQ